MTYDFLNIDLVAILSSIIYLVGELNDVLNFGLFWTERCFKWFRSFSELKDVLSELKCVLNEIKGVSSELKVVLN